MQRESVKGKNDRSPILTGAPYRLVAWGLWGQERLASRLIAPLAEERKKMMKGEKEAALVALFVIF